MSEERQANEFYKLFKRHLNGNRQAQLRVVQCESVDWSKKAMKAVDNDGLPYEDISLGFGSVCVKPAIGSLCVIGLLEGQDTAAWLLHTEKADEIVFNGGSLGGLTITPELVQQLGKMTARIDGIIAALKNGVPGSSDGGTAYKTSVVAALTALKDKEDFSKVEDEKIAH